MLRWQLLELKASSVLQGVGDALVRIVKDEGVAGLFRGAGPTVARAMALNMGMLASNDQVRHWYTEVCPADF